MGTLIGIIIILAICFLPGIITDYKFSNSLPPEGYQTDWAAMNRDLASGKTKMDVMRKSNNGGYYVKKK